MKKKVTLLNTVMTILLLLVACGAETPAETWEAEELGLTGTWQGETQMSVLGVGVEEPNTVDGTVTITFFRDENGVLEMDFGEEVPPVSQNFVFAVENDQLTLNLGQQTMIYTFRVAGDELHLDGRADFDLKRIS